MSLSLWNLRTMLETSLFPDREFLLYQLATNAASLIKVDLNRWASDYMHTVDDHQPSKIGHVYLCFSTGYFEIRSIAGVQSTSPGEILSFDHAKHQ